MVSVRDMTATVHVKHHVNWPHMLVAFAVGVAKGWLIHWLIVTF